MQKNHFKKSKVIDTHMVRKKPLENQKRSAKFFFSINNFISMVPQVCGRDGRGLELLRTGEANPFLWRCGGKATRKIGNKLSGPEGHAQIKNTSITKKAISHETASSYKFLIYFDLLDVFDHLNFLISLDYSELNPNIDSLYF